MQGAENIYSDKTYLESNANWHLEDAPWKAKEISGILERNRVLWNQCVEVGCGTGGVVHSLAKAHPEKQLAGYDISSDVVKFWQRMTLPNLRLVQGNYVSTNQTIDLILLIDVFEHVEDYMGFLTSLQSKAKWFVFHIPLDLHVQGLLRDSQMMARQKVGHLHYFSKSTALATLRDTGFEIIDHCFTDVAFEANKSTRALRTRILNPIRRLAAKMAPTTTAKILGGYSLMVLCRPILPRSRS
jgi:predicted TPR repeat methyltransferase